MGKRRKKDIYTGPNLTDQYDFCEDQQFEIKIKEYHQNGVGIGYIKDVPVWIFNSIVGETVLVKITKIFPEKLIAEIVSFNNSSKKRIKPICKFYGGCTGCQWQHISYDEQLKLKKSNIVKLLRNFNLIDVGFVMDTLPSKNNFNYRNHARFTVRKDFDKEKLGFINFLNINFAYLPVAAGSPGPFDKKIPFGFKDIIFSAGVFAGTTLTSQLRSEKHLKIFFLIP